MLDKSKVMSALERVSGSLFLDISQELNETRQLWQRIINDDLFVSYVRNAHHDFPFVHWMNELGMTHDIKKNQGDPYTIIGVDGSQIYPDRHQGATCFLINTGSVVVKYSTGSPYVKFATEPHVFSGQEENIFSGSPIDFVNCKREEFEFLKGLEIASSLLSSGAHHDPLLLLFDGSLIFWHLDSKDEALRMVFLNTYCAILAEMARHGILNAGYISVPKNKELVNLIRFGKSIYDKEPMRTDVFQHIIDIHVGSFFLRPFSRTTIFKHQSALSDLYPVAIRPHFFYLHVGLEIVRVEIPAWIADDAAKTDQVAAMITDNALKGNGYPVVLAEAHEQAVVKGPDREFFYHMIAKIGMAHNRHIAISPKSLKKRGMGI